MLVVVVAVVVVVVEADLRLNHVKNSMFWLLIMFYQFFNFYDPFLM